VTTLYYMTLFQALFYKLAIWLPAAQAAADAAPVPTEGGSGFGAGDLVKWGVVAVIAIAIIVVLRKVMGGGGVTLKGKVDRDVRKSITSRVRSGDLLGAGDLAFQERAYEDAADFYVEGKDFVRAADAFSHAGKRNDAIQYYKKAGQPQRAAELYEKAGQFRPAAHEYLNCGESERAAKLFMQAKDYRKAAEIYEELGRWHEGGEAYERLGLREKAAELYERFFDQELQLVRGNARKLSSEVRDRAVFVADFAESQGEMIKAAKIRERAGFVMEAARALAAAGKVDEAAKLYVSAKQPLQAAKLYEERGDTKKAASYRAEAALLRGDHIEAADELTKAGEFLRAADLYVDAGERLKAAAQFEQGRDFRSAAEQYGLAEEFADAARCYEEAGDYYRSSDLYHKLGNLEGELRCLGSMRAYFRLGRLLLEHDRKQEALQELQKVDKLDQNFQEACELQGDILAAMGQHPVALGKYRQAVAGTEPSGNNLSIFFKTADCLQATGDLTGALTLYEKVQAVDYFYEDAQERVKSLREELGASGGGGAAPRSKGWSQDEAGLARRPANVLKNASPTTGEDKIRYDVIEEIARGGMGVVYQAKDVVLNRIVAYKILSDNLKGNPTAVKYFLREARAAAALSHPNIVTVFDAGEQQGEYYMAMEFVEGETLKGLITRSGPFHEKLIRFIVVHACRGLQYAHDRGIVHRDIKSGNMMLTKEKTLKIMDFGLAKFLEEYQSTHTKAIGTPFYMSPEQIVGKNLDHRSDLYSLGVTLFECATGTVPFFKGDLSYHHLHTPPPSPRSLNPNLSGAMEAIILKLLEKSSDDRYQNANEVMKALRSR
jgi:eukaryotic-like serine/threonine-protein kinase